MDQGWLRRAIEVKRDGGEIEPAVWKRIVDDFVAGAIDAAPVAALTMACTIRGMGEDEIFALTDAMVESGEVLSFSGAAPVVDKHSSGGVGDTISLVVVPIVAACGIRVAKLSGRALGHTGGTLDKLEAIPGVRTDLTPAEFAAQVDRVGCAIAAQSARLVPADKLLYALRDRTGSVPSIGLIAASIVSKKIAGGAGAIVFDVKVGGGAFMRTPAEATALARTMVRLVERSGRRASAVVTDMDEPLAATVGTGIEVVAARDFLRGLSPDNRFAQLTATIAQEMLYVAGVPERDVAGQVAAALRSGAAYERFVALVEAQGGSRGGLEALEAGVPSSLVAAQTAGFVNGIDAVAIGEAARDLVGRCGPLAGIRMAAPVGTRVEPGSPLAFIAGSAERAMDVERAFTIAVDAPAERPLLTALIRDARVAPSSNEGA